MLDDAEAFEPTSQVQSLLCRACRKLVPNRLEVVQDVDNGQLLLKVTTAAARQQPLHNLEGMVQLLQDLQHCQIEIKLQK
jgi:hypothetical protein